MQIELDFDGEDGVSELPLGLSIFFLVVGIVAVGGSGLELLRHLFQLPAPFELGVDEFVELGLQVAHPQHVVVDLSQN
jgi:hypothetical protein